MKKIIIILTMVVSFSVIYISCKSVIKSHISDEISLKDLHNNPNIYNDSTVEVFGTIEETESFLGYSRSALSDGSDNINLISNKIYRKGEKINVKGKYIVLYQKNEKISDIIIAQDVKLVNILIFALKLGL